MEWLVLETVDAFIAPECIYKRVASEVQTIRREHLEDRDPDLKFMKSTPSHAGQGFIMHVDSETADAIENGTYEAWDCLNEHYEKTMHDVVRPESVPGANVAVVFEGTYVIPRAMKAYADLPGLIERNGKKVKVPTGLTNQRGRADICLDIDGTTHRYVFFAEYVSGSEGRYSKYFLLKAPLEGDIELEETWRKPPKSDRPDWFGSVCFEEEGS